ncbi:MAG: EhaF family protein [Methanomicrobiaceae archaeon]|nr:EhaF family protein [Methanomicrobiaceae archaeon]
MTGIIRRISRILQNHNNLVGVYAFVVIAIIIVGLLLQSPLTYDQDQLYPKSIDKNSSLDPYDRGGVPFGQTNVVSQYPENEPYLGYVTAYLTPVSLWISETTRFMGTTIVSHPGGIIDEILYNTRGLDTIIETAILFVAFTMAMFLFTRRREE